MLALIAIGFVWRPFAGQLELVIGLLGAGTAFALQEVIGAVADWASIISGRIFWVGDRIEIGGARGDVIDITLLRTKLMEIGGAVLSALGGGLLLETARPIRSSMKVRIPLQRECASCYKGTAST